MPKLVMPVTTPMNSSPMCSLEQLEDLDLPQLALGVVGAALGEADVLAELDQIVVGRDVLELDACVRSAGFAARLAARWSRASK